MENKIQNIFRLYFDGKPLPSSDVKAKAAIDIMQCKTEYIGKQIRCTCQDCGHEYYFYKSCGNRNCPHCQGIKQTKWVNDRYNEVLNVPYFHAVFTVPHELNTYFLHNQEFYYNLLFKSAAKAINTLSVKTKGLKAKLGFISVLHTWGANLEYHPHLHVIIPGVGITEKYRVVIANDKYLMNIKPLMSYFRQFFLEELIKETHIKEIPEYLIDNLKEKNWNVFIKDVYNNPFSVIKYLGRYTHRIAISDSRIISYDENHVTFSYKDYKNNSEMREMTLSTKEFVRRYLMHVLPRGFTKIRFYGLLGNKRKKKCIWYIRFILKSKFPSKRNSNTKHAVCPVCNSVNIESVVCILPVDLNQYLTQCKQIN